MPSKNEQQKIVRLSILISVFNKLELTKACLRSLQQTLNRHDYEIIIVDDCSTDGTREFLSTLGAPFRVALNETKGSFAKNNNLAARMAQGEILCLLNNDTILLPNWLEPMLTAFNAYPDLGFVGNVQRNPRTKLYDHMGIVFDPDGIPWQFGKGFFFRPFRGYREWPAVTAACCLVKRETFLKHGGFDETFINGSEDADLCLKMGKEGLRHIVAMESVIDHYVSSSPDRQKHTSANSELLKKRWSAEMRATWGAQQRKISAANYLLRHLLTPWRYNGPKLWRAFRELTKIFPFPRCLLW